MNKDLTPFPKFLKATKDFGDIDNAPPRTIPVGLLKQIQQEHKPYKYIPDDGEDLWLTPEEFKQRGGGDCTNFATSKMKAAKDLGIPESQMRLMVGPNTHTGEMHAVLHIDTGDGKGWVLDNQYPNHVIPDKKHYKLKGFSPLYKINRLDWQR